MLIHTVFPKHFAYLLLMASCWFFLQPLAATSFPPPTFLDPVPADVSVGCYNDRPAPSNLQAQTNMGVVSVSPRDSLEMGLATVCSGGRLFRIWEVSDDEGSTRVVQIITFGPPNAGPLISPTINITPDTVSCLQVNDPNDPLNYSAWRTDKQLALIAATIPGCSPIVNVTNNGPANLISPDCDDSLLVTYTVLDQCGQTATVSFRYVIEDRIAPIIQGIGADTLFFSCNSPVPPMPEISIDDCDANPTVIFNQFSNQLNNGSCAQYEYDIVRSWTATDDCGNSSTATQVLRSQDNEPPSFQRPFNIELYCTQDFNDLALTGNVSNLADNCTPLAALTVSYTDVIIAQPDCNFNFNVRRTWRVTDVCGNSNVQVQNIFVGDNVAPTFTPPVASVTVNCEDVLNFAVVGEPTDLFDDCTPNPNTSFEDTVSPLSCPSNYSIARRWRIFDDCGNAQTFTQSITVIDTTGPVFTTEPADLLTTCNNEQYQEQLFNAWTADLAGARVMDACSPANEVQVEIFVSGTTDFPLLPDFSCDAQDQTVRSMDVDIVATDACGNRRMRTVHFRQVDTQAPNVFDCPQDRVVSTDEGLCAANVAFTPPTIMDLCVTGLPVSHQTADTVQITSQAAPGQEGSTPVEEVILQLPVLLPLPVNALLPSTLTITLENIDGEGADEYFFIYGEDGSLLGTTNRSDVQCANSVTTFTIERLTFNQWAADGTITVRLVPNIPAGQPGTFAINDLCSGGSQVIGRLVTPLRRLAPIDYQIFIDDLPPITVDPVATYFANLDQGTHQIRYRVTDCAGNFTECMHTVTVEDRERPQLVCPPTQIVDIAADSCSATLEVPLPLTATDNCGLFTVETLTSPQLVADRFFRFNFDPNLNTYQASEIVASFPPISPIAFDTVQILVRFRGDFGSPNAILDILTNDGILLGSSEEGDANCNAEGRLLLRLPADQFNSYVADNNFGLRLVPRTILVPPGQSGDGVSSCNPSVTEGGTDGISYAYAEIRYSFLQATFFSTGALESTPSVTTQAQPFPRLTFPQGSSEFTYAVGDQSGNTDSCTFTIQVRDVTPPIARCLPTAVAVDPSGLSPTILPPSGIDNGSSDNCGIDNIQLSPMSFSCDQIGSSLNVTLSVFDSSGNTASCTVLVGIVGLAPQPTANSGFCGGDTLYLFANPPTEALPGQTIYTYQWFNPSNVLFSTEPNPFIPNITAANGGAYRVEITGLSGCRVSGVVNVVIQDLPLAPTIVAPQSVCIGDPIPLRCTTTFSGSVQYRWFEGSPGNGQLLGVTPTPTFQVLAPHAPSGRQFYLDVLVNGCESNPSLPISVTSVERPSVSIVEDSLLACQYSDVSLQANGPADVEYRWTSPTGLTSLGTTFELNDIPLSISGNFYVQSVRNEGCFSLIDSIFLEVQAATPSSSLSVNSPVCAGDTLLLTANDTASLYRFLGPNGQLINTNERSLRIANASATEQGAWRLISNANGCPSLPSVAANVVVNIPPVAQLISSPNPVCEGNNLQLQGSSNQVGSNFSWTGPNNFSSNQIAPSLSAVGSNASGTYTLRVTGFNGCSRLASLDITVLPGLAVNGIRQVVDSCLLPGERIQLVGEISPSDTSGTYQYQWQGPMGVSAATDTLLIPNVSLGNSGTYTLTVSNEVGCISPPAAYTVDLRFAPATPLRPFTADGQVGYCLGENFSLQTNDFGPGSLYFWQLPDGSIRTSNTNQIDIQAAAVSFSGNYSVRVVRNGCTSLFSAPREVLVTNFPVLQASTNTPVCGGQSIFLQITDLPGATYSWRGPNNFSSSLPNPLIGIANPTIHNGIYEVVVTIGGCRSDTIRTSVAVQPTPAAPVAVPRMPLCISQEEAVLVLSVNPNTATNGATYQWYTGDGTIPVGAPTTALNFELSDFSLFPLGGPTNFYVRAELDGCFGPLSEPIMVRLDVALPQAAQAGMDTVVCEGMYLLQAGSPEIGSGRWSVLSGGGDIFITNPNVATTIVNGLSEFGSPYHFLWSLSNGTCLNYSQDTLLLAVTSGEVAQAGPDILACLAEDANLAAVAAAEAGSQGVWTQNLAQEILGVVIEEPTNPTTLITGLRANNVYSFTWTISSNCGVKSDVVLVNVSDPSPDAGTDDIVCNSDRTAILAAAEPSLGSSGRWRSLNSQVNVLDPNSPTSMVSNLAVGDNRFVWEVDGGFCGMGSADTVVIEYKVPAQLQEDFVAVPFQGNVTFDPLLNDILPVGSVAQFPEQPVQGSISSSGLGSFVYTAPPNFVGEVRVVYLVLSDGCTASASEVTFQIGENADCGAPNIFTPNNDGINDFFVVPCLLDLGKYPASRVTIFNQWGDEVFRSSQPYQGNWDGRYQGQDLPVGTYYYLIDLGDGSKPSSGHVRIQR